MSKLEEKIIAKGQEIVESINASAKVSYEALKNELIEEAKKDLAIELNKAKLKADELVKQAKQESARALRDEVAISKQQLIETIFETLKKDIKKLKPADHFNYVLKSLQGTNISKDEEIRVSKNEYDMYKKILTTKDGDLVLADILNDKLGKGYQLKLSKKPAMIESGFMLIGELYDLNFSLENLLDSLTTKYEKTIYEALN